MLSEEIYFRADVNWFETTNKVIDVVSVAYFLV